MFKRVKNLSLQVKLSLIVVLALIIWIVSGVFSAKKIEEIHQKKGGGAVTLLAKEFDVLESHKIISGYGRVDRGQVNAISEINSHVVKINAKEGEVVEKGQKIVELLNGVLIPSTTSGTLDKIDVKAGDIVFAGQTRLFSVISNTKVDAILNIASSEARFVKSGQKVVVEIEKEKINGEVYFVSKISDKSTNTFQVKVKIQDIKKELFQDETVKILIKTTKSNGILIPTSALSITKESQLLITAINEDGVASKIPVEILNTESDGVWVSGPFSKSIVVVIRGADFVLDGEKVDYKIQD